VDDVEVPVWLRIEAMVAVLTIKFPHLTDAEAREIANDMYHLATDQGGNDGDA
jgi:hypothetical protein